MAFKISLFCKIRNGRDWLFNPYIVIGKRELCIDRDGFAYYGASQSFGYIRKSGFWLNRKTNCR